MSKKHNGTKPSPPAPIEELTRIFPDLLRNVPELATASRTLNDSRIRSMRQSTKNIKNEIDSVFETIVKDNKSYLTDEYYANKYRSTNVSVERPVEVYKKNIAFSLNNTEYNLSIKLHLTDIDNYRYILPTIHIHHFILSVSTVPFELTYKLESNVTINNQFVFDNKIVILALMGMQINLIHKIIDMEKTYLTELRKKPTKSIIKAYDEMNTKILNQLNISYTRNVGNLKAYGFMRFNLMSVETKDNQTVYSYALNTNASPSKGLKIIVAPRKMDVTKLRMRMNGYGGAFSFANTMNSELGEEKYVVNYTQTDDEGFRELDETLRDTRCFKDYPNIVLYKNLLHPSQGISSNYTIGFVGKPTVGGRHKQGSASRKKTLR